jgi:hypothetical protein
VRYAMENNSLALSFASGIGECLDCLPW